MKKIFTISDLSKSIKLFPRIAFKASWKFIALLIAFLSLLSYQGYAQVSGYGFKKKITIESDSVSGSSDLTNFPILISVTDADLKTTGNGGDVTDAIWL